MGFWRKIIKRWRVYKRIESLEVEFQIIKEIIEARKDKNITQKELSDLTGIMQENISKIEDGNANPSLKTLKKLASAFGKKLVISFE